MNDSEKLNTSLLKYENYIKKNPKKAYGYYCRGWIKFNLAKYKDAQVDFDKALSIDPEYTMAKMGLIIVNVFRRKFVQAVNLYGHYCKDISRKNVFKIKLIREISKFYSDDSFFSRKGKEASNPLFYTLTMHPLLVKYREDPDNVVLTIILAMYYMGVNERSLDIMNILKSCVYIDGVDDNMRWALLGAIADCGEKLYFDLDIASKFMRIPEPDCTDAYMKTIFGAIVLGRNKFKVKSVYNSMNKSGKKMTLNMMWKYVDWSWNVELYDLSVYECCNRLLMSGWADILVLEMMVKLEKQNIITITDEERKVLDLYGYCT